jgi:hypothetical protein
MARETSDPGDPRPAPDDLEELRQFVNSDNRYHHVDCLVDEELRRRWFASVFPDVDHERIPAAGWRRLVELRDRIREAVATGDVGPVDDVARDYPVRLAFTPPRLAAAGEDVEHAIAVTVLGALHQAARDGRLSRLRLCQRPDCGWCYYDGSRNRSARWCSADPCGDVMKTRAYRERQKAH